MVLQGKIIQICPKLSRIVDILSVVIGVESPGAEVVQLQGAYLPWAAFTGGCFSSEFRRTR